MNRRTIPLVLTAFIIIAISSSVFADNFSGDGTHTISDGDKVTADNGYYITINEIYRSTTADATGYVSFQMHTTYGTTLSEGEEGKFSLAASGGDKVLRVVINSIDANATSASITIESILEEEEQPDIPLPDDGQDTGIIYTGDGTYNLNKGDSVVSDSGYTIEFDRLSFGFDRNNQRIDDAVLIIKDTDNNTLLERSVTENEKATEILELGMTVTMQNLDLSVETISLTVKSSLKVDLQQGWNLFSVPLSYYAGTDDCNNAVCYGPGTNGLKVIENTCGDLDSLKIWKWDSTNREYIKTLPYTPYGYWVKMEETCSITFAMNIVNLEGFALHDGWNSVGGPTKSVQFDDIKGDCTILSGPWRYLTHMNKYERTSFLAAGEGYFIKVSGDCTLG